MTQSPEIRKLMTCKIWRSVKSIVNYRWQFLVIRDINWWWGRSCHSCLFFLFSKRQVNDQPARSGHSIDLIIAPCGVKCHHHKAQFFFLQHTHINEHLCIAQSSRAIQQRNDNRKTDNARQWKLRERALFLYNHKYSGILWNSLRQRKRKSIDKL